jgi:hypothetical protein
MKGERHSLKMLYLIERVLAINIIVICPLNVAKIKSSQMCMSPPPFPLGFTIIISAAAREGTHVNVTISRNSKDKQYSCQERKSNNGRQNIAQKVND